MPITNVKTFIRPGRSDVFLLDPGQLYEITTIGVDGNQSDVHVWRSSANIGSGADAALATNWTLHQDTGASGDLTDSGTPVGTLKMLVDVIDPLVDGGAIVTLKALGALTGAYDKSPGLLFATQQRQKNSSNRRRVN